jgi:hypothetical protein
MCHGYKAPGRDCYAWETTVAEERASNIQIYDGISEDEFVEMRSCASPRMSGMHPAGHKNSQSE